MKATVSLVYVVLPRSDAETLADSLIWVDGVGTQYRSPLIDDLARIRRELVAALEVHGHEEQHPGLVTVEEFHRLTDDQARYDIDASSAERRGDG